MKKLSDEELKAKIEAEQNEKKKKKSPSYKFMMFANLMTIPALAFYFYVGLGGQMNGYFLLVILMIISEFLIMRKHFKD